MASLVASIGRGMVRFLAEESAREATWRIMKYTLPYWAVPLMGMGVAGLAKLLALPWPAIALITLFGVGMAFIIIDRILAQRGRQALRIVTCDEGGNHIGRPKSEFWKSSHDSYSYQLRTFIKLENRGIRKLTLEDAYFVLSAKRHELEKRAIDGFPIGERIAGGAIYHHPIKISEGLMVGEYELQKAIGFHLERARCEIVIQTQVGRARTQFQSEAMKW